MSYVFNFPVYVRADCPVWDHVVQLFACCRPPGAVAPPLCKPCHTTPWLATGRNGPIADASGRSHGPSMRASAADELCGPELGRWITPFRWSLALLKRIPLFTGFDSDSTRPFAT